jgi:glycerol-3-phosphate O-acyltransferase/dihydroxyacetone phosphate acyltransferase
MAASSYSKPVVGQLAKGLKVIPVARPEDSKKKGSGKVRFESSTHVKGNGTKFIEEVNALFKSGISGIVVKSKTFIVDKIIDNETLLLKENKEESGAVLDGELDYFFLPKIDNSTLFKEAYRRLEDDGCICIFPEGTSHDRTEFIKLKAGIALMTLGAMSEAKCKPVRIVPVGLNYYKREEFRSEVVIEFGKPFEVPSEWAEEYKVNKRESTEKLLKEIEARMKAVTLTAPSYQELRSLFLVRKLYVPPEAKLTATQYNELCKRFSKGYEKLKEREDTQILIKKVNKYINELESTGINDHEVKKIDFNYVWIVRKSFWSFILFHIFLILCLPAIFILSPFAYLIKKKAEKERLLVIKKLNSFYLFQFFRQKRKILTRLKP